MRYIGVDLAWSERSGSGASVLDGDGSLLDEDQLGPHQLAPWIRHWQGDAAVLAIDGPLVVRPGSPALRPVERELHRRYGHMHAGPYPGGGASAAMRGRVRSPAAALVDSLGTYSIDPTDRVSAHRAIEVFPAPAWIEVFALTERIVYKRGRLAERIVALGRLRALLDSLAGADLPLLAGSSAGFEHRVTSARTGRDWKAVEDILDARLCAYVALLWDRQPNDAWVVTGDATWRDGYVVIPALARWAAGVT
jgi:predicted RNase H-like nuclease